MQSKVGSYIDLIERDLYSYFNTGLEEYKIIHDSMKYSINNGGKRVRPLLTLLFCKACGGNVKNALPIAEAVEFIHTYSLIHDDLPCMDNDDFRRGKPSNHKVYGEAFALLAGDGLLTAAFNLIAKGCENRLYNADVAIKAVSVLSELAGSRGMIGGQVIDLQNENNPNADFKTLELMDNLKTGALIEAACTLGCIAAGATEERISYASQFARKIGLAFQIKDDILDVTSSLEKLGKMTGSDEDNSKSTYVTLLGVEKCQELVDNLTDEALSLLDNFPDNEVLKQYAQYLSQREN
ncbi:MAG: polyprenyl synthetase family protein [Oscillospiraceae bacterium]|nr:polyprenyl synthetase family protein [Oscillospiraceae bacterium]